MPDRNKKVTPLASPSYIEDRELLEKVKRKRRRGLARRLAVFFILVGIGAVMMTSYVTSQQETIAKKEQKQAEVQQKLSHMQKTEHTLKGKVDKLHDLDYIGKLARRDLLMTKKGEVVFTKTGDGQN